MTRDKDVEEALKQAAFSDAKNSPLVILRDAYLAKAFELETSNEALDMMTKTAVEERRLRDKAEARIAELEKLAEGLQAESNKWRRLAQYNYQSAELSALLTLSEQNAVLREQLQLALNAFEKAWAINWGDVQAAIDMPLPQSVTDNFRHTTAKEEDDLEQAILKKYAPSVELARLKDRVVTSAKGLTLEDGALHGCSCEYFTNPESGICRLCEAEDKLREDLAALEAHEKNLQG